MPITFSFADWEEERLDSLAEYDVLSAQSQDHFDRVVAMARRRFDVPIAFLAFVGRDETLIRAGAGIATGSCPRGESFCSHAILDNEVLIVPDIASDFRFRDHPFIRRYPKLRFYAGAPLIVGSGHHIGTLCIADTDTRDTFDTESAGELKDLAQMISSHLERRRWLKGLHDYVSAGRVASNG